MFSRTTFNRAFCALLCCCPLLLPAADYYWIGGSGEWSDVTHWATTSGGTTTHAQVPTAEDDVFFDQNSFTGPMDMVRFNASVMFCRSMDWTGATGGPVALGGDQVNLAVFGYLQLIPAMEWSFTGRITFTGDGANPIDFGGQIAARNLDFDGTGAWLLLSPLAVTENLRLREGELNTDGQPVTAERFLSQTERQRRLDLGTSTVVITADDYNPDDPTESRINELPAVGLNGERLTLRTRDATFRLTGRRADFFATGLFETFVEVVNNFEYTSPIGYSVLRTDPANGINPAFTFLQLTLAHDALLDGGFSIGNTNLSAGRTYELGSGQFIFLNGLNSAGDCSSPITLSSPSAANPARIGTAGTANSFRIDFAVLRNIAVEFGNAQAFNAIDLGGNTGWTIEERTPNNFYWIGGTGNWDEPANWSNTSGGPAAGCLPSLADNVFFDANSFSAPGQTVTVNVPQADCGSMTWSDPTGTPVFAGPAANLVRVNGSLSFAAGMEHDFRGDYEFLGRQLHTLRSAGQRFNRDIAFTNTGAYTLLDGLNVYEIIDFATGTLNTAGQPVRCNRFLSLSQSPRELHLGASVIDLFCPFDRFRITQFRVETGGLTLDPGTSVINLNDGQSGVVSAWGTDPVRLHTVNFYSPNNVLEGYTVANGNDGTGITADTLRFFNNGYLGGNNTAGYVFLNAGQSYRFQENFTQTFGEMVADGDCERGLTSLLSSRSEFRADLVLPAGSVYDRLLLRDVEVAGGAPAVANNSVRLGGTPGWIINEPAARTLYWVGGSGDWFDRSHWSLTAGGPGGECVPTLLDDVIFGAAGNPTTPFFVGNQSVRYGNCRDLTFRADLTGPLRFDLVRMRIRGNFLNQTDLDYGVSQTFFYGFGDRSITMNGASFEFFTFDHYGDYVFTDPIDGHTISYVTGDLVFDAPTSRVNRLLARSSLSDKGLTLNDVDLTLRETGRPALEVERNSKLSIEPGNSRLEFTGTNGTARIERPVDFARLEFSSPDGVNAITNRYPQDGPLNVRSVVFNGNGALELGNLVTDTLIFAAGKDYSLLAGEVQTINDYWQTLGNNCTPISIRSSSPGSQARTRVPATGTVLADFVQMRNLTATGGADYNAGSRSTNIANSNVGWSFTTAPQFETVGFLGEDRVLCATDAVTLDAFNFSPGETYRWSDGSTQRTLTTTVPGAYGVEVTFGNNCVIRDTTVILDPADYEVDLPTDTTVCDGAAVPLSAEAGINTASYRWQDGSTAPDFVATTTGQYTVVVDLDGCTKTDTFFLTVTPIPTVNILEERLAPCVGTDFLAEATGTAESYAWSEGSSTLNLTGDQGGRYVLTATNGNCSVTDSVLVEYVDPGTINLGADTVLCDADQLLLGAPRPGFTYRWQDGSTQPVLTASASGTYSVTADTAGCTTSDTIVLDFPVAPVFDLQPTYEQCAGLTFRLTTATTPADAYRWSDGQTGPEFVTTTPGDYFLAVDYSACADTQAFTVDFPAPPALDLGDDRTACAGETVVLDAALSGIWQDGTVAVTYPVSEAGTYAITVTEGPCTVADSVNVAFRALPTVDLGPDQTGCVGDELTVRAQTDSTNLIFWPDGTSAFERSFDTAAVYSVEVEDAAGCVGTDSVELSFRELPFLDLGPDTTFCADRPLVLVATGDEGSILWQDGTRGERFRVREGGLILAVLSDGLCTTLDSVRVTLEDCVDFKAYLPTAFSPNLDGINDAFGPQFSDRITVTSFRMEVYDRWGAQVFVTEDLDRLWEGEDADGRPARTGVYVYSIAISYVDDRGPGSRQLSGDVSLLR